QLVVRTREQYAADVRAAAASFFVAFWIAHLVRRWRRADDEPLVLPVLLLLCGLGLMTMLALRDPLRDTTTASTFVSGVVIGLVLLVSASEMDFEASPLRRAVLAPLGPALVLSCGFLALCGIARGRSAFVVTGFTLLVAGFTAAYQIGFPATVRQRVTIWFDPWNNGIVGGNQIAHGLWALSTGAFWGTGPGLGEPQVIPAAYTDFVLAAIGEELGLAGLVIVVALY